MTKSASPQSWADYGAYLSILADFSKNGKYTKCPQDLSEGPEALKKVFLVPN